MQLRSVCRSAWSLVAFLVLADLGHAATSEHYRDGGLERRVRELGSGVGLVAAETRWGNVEESDTGQALGTSKATVPLRHLLASTPAGSFFQSIFGTPQPSTASPEQEEPMAATGAQPQQPTVDKAEAGQPTVADDADPQPPVTADDAQADPLVTADHADPQPPVTADDAQAEPPVTADDAEAEQPVTADDAEAERPVTADDAEAERPVTADDAEAERPVTADDAEAERPVTADDAEAERPVTADDAEAEAEQPATATSEAEAPLAVTGTEPFAERAVRRTKRKKKGKIQRPARDDGHRGADSLKSSYHLGRHHHQHEAAELAQGHLPEHPHTHYQGHHQGGDTSTDHPRPAARNSEKVPMYVEECFANGILAILYATTDFGMPRKGGEQGPYVALTGSSNDLQAMLCFDIHSMYLAPGVKLTLTRTVDGSNATFVFDKSQRKLDVAQTERALVADIELNGRFVEYAEPEVPHSEALGQMAIKTDIGFQSKHASSFRFDKSKRFLLKALNHARFKKPRVFILPRGKKVLMGGEAWPSPDACFAVTHIHSAQRGCHHDPAWLGLAKEFVPRFGGLTPNPGSDPPSDIAAIENGLHGLKDVSLVDLDVATRMKGPCGLDVKHVDVAGNKKLSMGREGKKGTREMPKKESVGTQVALIERMLKGGGKHSAKEAAELLAPKLERAAELLSRQRVAMLYDSSILMIVGTNATGQLEGRVKLIDFGKEIHVYQWLIPKMIPTKGMTRGQRCAYGCGAMELSKQMGSFAAGGKGKGSCMAPCSFKTWKNKSCQPITVPSRLNGYKADYNGY